jgi:hypothetical protein
VLTEVNHDERTAHRATWRAQDSRVRAVTAARRLDAMSNPGGTISAYVFPGSWAGVDAVRATVYLRGSLAIGVMADIEVAGMVQLSGPWVRIVHDGGTVIVPFDQVASIVEQN